MVKMKPNLTKQLFEHHDKFGPKPLPLLDVPNVSFWNWNTAYQYKTKDLNIVMRVETTIEFSMEDELLWVDRSGIVCLQKLQSNSLESFKVEFIKRLDVILKGEKNAR